MNRSISLFGQIKLVTLMAVVYAATVEAGAANPTNRSSSFPNPTEIDQQLPSVGVRAGATNPARGYDGTLAYGLEAGFRPYAPFGVGIELEGLSSAKADSNTLNRTTLLAKGAYNIGGSTPIISKSYLGMGLGPVADTQDRTTKIHLGYEVDAGFDIPLTSSGQLNHNAFSLGANANYLFVSDASPNALGLTGLMKFWF